MTSTTYNPRAHVCFDYAGEAVTRSAICPARQAGTRKLWLTGRAMRPEDRDAAA